MTKTPKVMGTLSIVFGSLTAAWSPLSLFMRSFMKGMSSFVSAMPRQPGMRDPAIDMGAAQAMLDAQGGYVAMNAIAFTLMSVALIVVGIGLVKRRQWARQAAIGWSIAALVLLVVQCIAYFTHFQAVWMHARDTYYAAHDVPPPPTLSTQAQSFTAVISWMLYAIFPTVMLVLMRKRSAAADYVA